MLKNAKTFSIMHEAIIACCGYKITYYLVVEMGIIL